MPRDLFAQNVASVPRRSPWTLASSLLAHGAIIAAIVVVPIVSGAASPDLRRRLERFVMAETPVLPPPPVARAPAATTLPPEIKVNAAPLVAPDGVTLNPPVFSSGVGEAVPGALPVGAGGAPTNLFSTAPTTTLSAPPAPAQTGPVRVGGDIQAPARVSYAPPVYPPIAITARVEGTVVLEATIDESGAVNNLRVLESIPLLDRAAIEAVTRWRYTPTRLNGKPVAVLMTVRVTFTLR